MLCRQHGAQLCYTPMLHSRLFAESAEYREKMFEKHIHDRPLVVQVPSVTSWVAQLLPPRHSHNCKLVARPTVLRERP